MEVDEHGESMPASQNYTSEPTSFIIDDKSSTSKSKGKCLKRKYAEGIEMQFMENMGTYCNPSNSKFGQIIEIMEGEYDNRVRREHVYDALSVIDFIIVEARVDVAQYLCNNLKDMNLFFSLPDEAKSVLVTRITQNLASTG
ncbi:hypothetical protein ACS0TY_024873 [Phlomoides rotata]